MTTAQEVFNKAARGILDQGEQCKTEPGSCLYVRRERDDDGNVVKELNCAAGKLLSKEQLDVVVARGLNSGPWQEVMHLAPELVEHAVLIKAIQFCHDTWKPGLGDFLAYFRGGMVQVALRFSLDDSIPRNYNLSEK